MSGRAISIPFVNVANSRRGKCKFTRVTLPVSRSDHYGIQDTDITGTADYEEFPSFDADATFRKWNLWSYIDGHDGA
jgi:hypothetical protein